MDTTIRNLDVRLYRALRARAAREGRTVGALINDALRVYLTGIRSRPGGPSLFDLEATAYPPGNERLSEAVDTVVYGGPQS